MRQVKSSAAEEIQTNCRKIIGLSVGFPLYKQILGKFAPFLTIRMRPSSCQPVDSQIEHVLPKTWTDPYWTSRWNSEEAGRHLHDLGNMSLTFSNSSYSNKSFPNKKGKPGEGVNDANASTFMERDLARFDDWTPAVCEQRREQIVAWVIDRWGMSAPLDSTSAPPPAVEDDGDDAADKLLLE